MEQLPFWLKVVICVLICQAVGISTGLVTASSITDWYVHLEKPSFNPPNWIFGPAWTILYTLMGLAAAYIWEKGWKRSDVKMALGVFALQLALNGAWTLLFFGLRNPAIALVEILVLLCTIVLTISLFWKIRARAGALMVPYLLWTCFATVLNVSIWYLNGGIS